MNSLKKKRAYRYFLYTVLGASVGIAHAFIYTVRVAKRWHVDKQRYHYVIALGDFHASSVVTLGQQHAIHELLQQYSRHSSHVVVEDLSDQARAQCAGRFRIALQASTLGGLTVFCKNNSISVTNVEFRFARVVALAHLFNNPIQDATSVPLMASISMQSVFNETQRALHDVAAYQDGVHAKAWYAVQLKKVRQQLDYFISHYRRGDSVADYIVNNRSRYRNQQVMVEQLLTFDSVLLDSKIMHEIIRQGDKAYSIVIAGGSHIDSLCTMLQSVGYTVMGTAHLQRYPQPIKNISLQVQKLLQ